MFFHDSNHGFVYILSSRDFHSLAVSKIIVVAATKWTRIRKAIQCIFSPNYILWQIIRSVDSWSDEVDFNNSISKKFMFQKCRNNVNHQPFATCQLNSDLHVLLWYKSHTILKPIVDLCHEISIQHYSITEDEEKETPKRRNVRNLSRNIRTNECGFNADMVSFQF